MTKLTSLIALDPPSVIGGSGSRSSEVKGHFEVKTYFLQERSTQVTRGHFEVTVYLKFTLPVLKGNIMPSAVGV